MGLLLCLATLTPACGNGGSADDDEDDDEASEQESSTSKGEAEGSSDASSSSTGGSSTSTTDSSTTSKDSTGDSSSEDPGSKLGKCDRSLAPTTTVSEDIKASVTWKGVVKISGEVELHKGVVLTIEAGTTVLADAGAKLMVGDRIDPSSLIANGTQAAPIRFCGATDSAGSWKGIELGDETKSQSVLSHVRIENAGVNEGAALAMYAPVRLDHVEISGSAGHGVFAHKFGPDSKGLRIEQAQMAVRLLDAAAVQTFPAGSVLKDNLNNAVELDFDSMESETTFRDLGVPYRQLGDLRLRDKAKMVLQEGVEYEVAARRELEVGDFRGEALFRSEGTQNNPVVIRGVDQSPGSWRGISVGRDSSAQTSFVHTVIQHGGDNGQASLELERAIKVEHLTVQDALNGVEVKHFGFAPGSTHLSVKNTKGYALRVHAEAIVGLPAGGTFENNERSVVWVERGEIEKSGTIVKMPVPYQLEGTTRLGRKVDLVVAPGTHFKMGERANLWLDPYDGSSSVVMKGTDAERIKFMGAQASAGYWGSVRAGKDLKANSAFEYVEFAHGGSGYRDGMLDLERSFPVQKCVFTDSGSFGISRDRDDSTDYTKNNEFKNNKEGAVGN